MKYGIVGNRDGWEPKFVSFKISDIIFNDKSDEITEVTIISGGAGGVDALAKVYAIVNGIHYKEFMPNQAEPFPERYFNRNKRIAEECDVLIAFDKKVGRSGTKNTIKHARELDREVIIVSSQKNGKVKK